MSAGVGQRAERGTDDHDLSLGDTSAAHVLDATLDRPGWRLSAQQRRLGHEKAPQREGPRARASDTSRWRAGTGGHAPGGDLA